MAILRPFQAWRYNPEKVDLGKVLAPPYDVIDPEFREVLYDRHPCNVVRLILGKSFPRDDEQNNTYTRARKYFDEWINSEILIREPEPSLYVYQQAFKHPETGKGMTRSALWGLVRLEDFREGVIFPHEETSAVVKYDRMRLLRATETNLSPVFGLYQDRNAEIRQTIKRCLKGSLVFQTWNGEGVKHILWRIAEPAVIRFLTHAFRRKKIVLADGHHRYETALAYRSLLRRGRRRAVSEVLPHDFVLMALVSVDDPGLLVLPTHRLIQKSVFEDPHWNALEGFFRVKEVSQKSFRNFWVGPGSRSRRSHPVIGLYLGAKRNRLLEVVRAEEVKWAGRTGRRGFREGVSPGVAAVLALEHWLKAQKAYHEEETDYSHSYKDAIRKVDTKVYRAAFLMKPIPIKEIVRRSFSGERFPRKTTYFYPKLASGVLFYSHRDVATA